MDEYNPVEKDNLISQLDRHLDWIKSCDTKASIVLAVIGIFITLFTSEHSLEMLNDILSRTINNNSFSNFLYLLFFALPWCSFIYGAYCLIRVLVPRLSKETNHIEDILKDSLYFFESIAANNTFSTYKEKALTRTMDDEITDLLSQIYVKAQICTIKFAYYSKGIKYAFVGIAGILALFIIGVIIFKAGGFS